MVGPRKGVFSHLAFPLAVPFGATPNVQAAKMHVVPKAPRANVASGVTIAKCMPGKWMLEKGRTF